MNSKDYLNRICYLDYSEKDVPSNHMQEVEEKGFFHELKRLFIQNLLLR